MSDKNLIATIKKTLSSLEQLSFISDGTEEKLSLLEACIAYIKSYGYKVIKNTATETSNFKPKAIIDLFYNLFSYKYPHRLVVKDEVRDRNIAKSFINARMTAMGTDTSTAISECMDIIKFVFENEDSFHFDRIIDFNMFSQGPMVWVTDKAVQTMNAYEEERKMYEYEQQLDREAEEYFAESASLIDEIDEKRRREKDDEEKNKHT